MGGGIAKHLLLVLLVIVLLVATVSSQNQSCTLLDAQWIPLSSTEGNAVSLAVSGTGACHGLAISFEAFEDDGLLPPDEAAQHPAPAIFVSQTATTSWIAEYQELAGNAEWYFVATIANTGESIQSSANQNLIVQPSSGSQTNQFGASNFVVSSNQTQNTSFEVLQTYSDDFDNPRTYDKWNYFQAKGRFYSNDSTHRYDRTIYPRLEINNVQVLGVKDNQTVNRSQLVWHQDGSATLPSPQWWQDQVGPMIFKNVQGDFIIEAQVTAENKARGLNTPTTRGSTAGLIARDPTGGLDNWVKVSYGTRFSDGQVGTQSINTVNSVASTFDTAADSNHGLLRICRVGNNFYTLKKSPADGSWVQLNQFTRSMSNLLQVGMATSARDATGLNDMEAQYDYVHFARPYSAADCSVADINAIDLDTNAPVIENVHHGTPGPGTARITWFTNESATSMIEWGRTNAYGNVSRRNNAVYGNLTNDHQLFMFNLIPNTQYHYRVRSIDAKGNEQISADQTLTTGNRASNGCHVPGNSTEVYAMDFDYHVVEDKGRYLYLAATSPEIDFENVQNRGSRATHYPLFPQDTPAITEWRINEVPQNGKLYYLRVPDNWRDSNIPAQELRVGDIVENPDDLFYEPDLSFTGNDTFEYCVLDKGGRQSGATAIQLQVHDSASYPMPIGIPNPNFGINEQPPADPAQWPAAEAMGYYYIDSDYPSCTDSSNEFGYPNRPRCAMPHNEYLQAGKKMVLAQSTLPYDMRFFHGARRLYLRFNATPAQPFWIVGDDRGPNKPRLVPIANDGRGRFDLFNSNFRVSGVQFDHVGLVRGSQTLNNSALLHSRFMRSQANGGSFFAIGGYDFMIFQSQFNDVGRVHPTLYDEQDVHAVVPTTGNRSWFLDSVCSETAGDCIQFINIGARRSGPPEIYNMYMGRLDMHSSMENCLDVKDFGNFVLSESSCWDIRRISYFRNSGGGAQNWYVNDEGTQVGNAVMINNRAWDTNGIGFGTNNIGGKVFFVGNRVFFSPEARALDWGVGGAERHAYLNTFDNVKRGLSLFNTPNRERFASLNFIGNYTEAAAYKGSDVRQMDYNIYEASNPSFLWGSSTTPTRGSFATWRSTQSVDANSQIGVNPQFVNRTFFDFRTVGASGLREVATPAAVSTVAPGLATLAQDFGITIADFMGNTRPQDADTSGVAEMDVGAFEAAGSICTNGQTRACPLQQGVCAGSTETCTNSNWPTCTAVDYGGNYEALNESSCSDGLDNDCDGSADGADSDCRDNTAPVVSSVGSSAVTDTTATITWTTNEPASSRVDYGPTNSYGQFVVDNTLKTSHSVQLTGLQASTQVHYRVESTDASSNTQRGSDQTFTTTSGANIIYVDNQLGTDCSGDYSIAARACTGADGDAYQTIQGAVLATTPGTIVRIRDGNYSRQSCRHLTFCTTIEVSKGGTAAQPVIYENYANEVVRVIGFGYYDEDLRTRGNISLGPDGWADGPVNRSSRQILLQIDAAHTIWRNMEFLNATATAISVRAPNTQLINLRVYDNWNNGIAVGTSTDDHIIIEDVLLKNIEAHNNRHGNGILIGRSGNASSNTYLNFTRDVTVLDSLAYRNGYQSNGSKVLPIRGDPAGGGNSDAMGTFKICSDRAGEMATDNICYNIRLIDSIGFGNADDGFDLNLKSSLVSGIISFDNGPEGNRGVKILRPSQNNTFQNNIAYANLDSGFEFRVDVNASPWNVRDNIGAYNPRFDIGNRHMYFYNNLAFGPANTHISGICNVSICSENWDENLNGTPQLATLQPTIDTNFPAGLNVTQKIAFIRSQFESAWTPTAGSPLIDAGRFIPNYHCPSAGSNQNAVYNGVACKEWHGGAPDIGVFEYNPQVNVTDSTAPTISNIANTTVSQTAIDITWNTNEPATSRVDFGLTSSYGRFVADPTFKTNHRIRLSSLQASTQYHFQITSGDASGNNQTTTDQTFRTAGAGDLRPPTIVNIVPRVPDPTRAVITWQTDEPSITLLRWGDTRTTPQTVADANFKLDHRVALPGLNANQLYHFKIVSEDAAGNQKTSQKHVFSTDVQDVREPRIFDIRVVDVGLNTATVVWFTDEPSSSVVNYGLNSNYTATVRIRNLTIFHEVTLTNLSNTTTYHYSISSSDPSRNTRSSGDRVFATASGPSSCGNGIQEFGEQCDGADFGRYNVPLNPPPYREGFEQCRLFDKQFFFGRLSCSSCVIDTGTCGNDGKFNFSYNWSHWDTQKTTNLSKFTRNQILNLSRITFANSFGEIIYNRVLNFTRNVNIAPYIRVNKAGVFVDSERLRELNTTAIITIHNVTAENPKITRDGVDCPADVCQIISFENGTVVFNVTKFSTYTVVEAVDEPPFGEGLVYAIIAGFTGLVVYFFLWRQTHTTA